MMKIKSILSWALCAVIVSSLVVWAAQVAILQTDTREEAWGKETLNNSDLQSNIDLKAPISSPTFTGLITTEASDTSEAGLNIPHGTAPTSL